jgi:hypothetical protein
MFFVGSTNAALSGCLCARSCPKKVGARPLVPAFEGPASKQGSGATRSVARGRPGFFNGGLPLRGAGFSSCSLFSLSALRFAKSFFASSWIVRAYNQFSVITYKQVVLNFGQKVSD